MDGGADLECEPEELFADLVAQLVAFDRRQQDRGELFSGVEILEENVRSPLRRRSAKRRISRLSS
ncbi:MAG TPA: hypothetical protein VF219_02135, partial [Vicinamibacterales bacterium]